MDNKYLYDNAGECTLFLKRNKEFPILKPCRVALYGNGARNTVKGGSGSGDVDALDFLTIESALEKRGFRITTKEWLDQYDELIKKGHKDYIKETKREAKKLKISPMYFSLGYFPLEKNHSIEARYDGDICIYVLKRECGEGNDRRNEKGDFKLTDKEVEDILFLNNKFKKFMLVLNVGGVLDLSPVLEVSNILLLSQLGLVTGDIFTSILLGECNPSGKLTTSWTKYEDYPFYSEFENINDTYYKEGIYVGYRYFSTLNKKVLFPFGYGLSYTDFSINVISSSVTNMDIKLNIAVENIGVFSGKEVVQVYLSKPSGRIVNPKIELCAYKKTKMLKSGECDNLEIEFSILDNTSYDEENECYMLQKGDYLVSIGNSSDNIKTVLKVYLDKDLIIKKVKNKLGCCGFSDFKPSTINEDIDVLEYKLDYSNVKTKIVEYKRNSYIEPNIEKLTNKELAYICLGNHSDFGIAAMVGVSAVHVIGGAGETTLRVKSLDKSLTMADGPAGIRIKSEYGVDKKGIYDTKLDPIMSRMIKFLPSIARPLISPSKHRHGVIHHQPTTALPIATALAQSFNDEFLTMCGKIVGEEMDKYGIDLWLAPALNIHRNVLCGRNFEYFSEDPYLSGMVAGSIALGVENKRRGVTLKHFAFNNQELNRNNNNSHVSERAAREIYLKGFEICINRVNPKAIMTSYNLINGVHTSEAYNLINDILRCEWDYEGLVMTDWVKSGRVWCKASKYEAMYASKGIKAGNDLTMPGCKKDHKDIMKALKRGYITRRELLCSASRVYRAILKQKN